VKRDLDLIREILLGIEANATFKVTPVPVLGLPQLQYRGAHNRRDCLPRHNVD